MVKKPKILIPYIESGYGHIMAAEAFAQSLKERYGGDFELIETYIMREDNNEHLIGMERFLTSSTQLTNKLPVFGKSIFPFIRCIGGVYFMRNVIHKGFGRKSFLATIEVMKKYAPDVIICPHYYLGICAIEYKKRYNANVEIITYDPDANFFMAYDCRDGWFFVNCDRAEREALRRGIKPEKLIKIPLPKRGGLSHFTQTKEECRAKHGIAQDSFVLTIADGAYMLGKAKAYTKYFLKHINRPITIVLMTGHNSKNRLYFEKIKNSNPNVDLMLIPFTNEAHEYYRAADLLMTKAGATAVQDGISMRTPLMVNFCPHGIETANYKVYVRQYGCGVGAFTKRRALRELYALMDDPKRLEIYRENIDKLQSQSNGADKMADFIYELCYKTEKQTPQNEPTNKAENEVILTEK